MFFIYTILNTQNYKMYVGQTQDVNHRWSAHKCEANADRLHYPLYKALRKYGFDKFQLSVVEIIETAEQADVAETFWIDRLNTRDSVMGYNLAPGGSVPRGWHHSEESKRKISKSNMGKIMPPHTQEWKNKMSKIMTGRVIDEEWRRKLSLSNKNRIITDKERERLSKLFLGKSHSDETKKKMSLAKLGKNKSEETKQKMSRAKRKFSQEQELCIVNDRNYGMTYEELGVKYGCSRVAAWNIVKRHS